MLCHMVKIDIFRAVVPSASWTSSFDGIGGLVRRRARVVWSPKQHSPRDSKICGKNENLNKKSYFLGWTYFKLRYIRGNSINYGDLLLKIVISVRDGHCVFSAQVSTSLATPLDGIIFPCNVGQHVPVDTTSHVRRLECSAETLWQPQTLQMIEINCWIICVHSRQISR